MNNKFPPEFNMFSALCLFARFRHPGPMQMQQRPPLDSSEEAYKRPPVITDKDLKSFDNIMRLDKSDEGWAGAQGDIDYS